VLSCNSVVLFFSFSAFLCLASNCYQWQKGDPSQNGPLNSGQKEERPLASCGGMRKTNRERDQSNRLNNLIRQLFINPLHVYFGRAKKVDKRDDRGTEKVEMQAECCSGFRIGLSPLWSPFSLSCLAHAHRHWTNALLMIRSGARFIAAVEIRHAKVALDQCEMQIFSFLDH